MVSVIAWRVTRVSVSKRLAAFTGLWPACKVPRVELRLALWDDDERGVTYPNITRLLYPPALKRYTHVVVCNQFFPCRAVISRNMALREILGGSSVEHVYVASIALAKVGEFKRAVVKRCVTTILREADMLGRDTTLQLARAVYDFMEGEYEADDNVVALRNILLLTQTQ